MAKQAVIERDEQSEAIRKEVLADKAAPKEEGKKPWEVRLENDHPELAPGEKKPVKEVEEKPAEEQEEAPKEEEKPDGDQPAETEAQPEPEEKEQPAEEEAQPEAKKDTADEVAYIAEYAKKEGITVEAAKEEIDRSKAILAKYNNDPMQVAKAYRLTQSEYDKLKTQAETNKQSATDPVAAAIIANPRGYASKLIKDNAEKLITEFRQENPARSRDMDDEQITEELTERAASQLQSQLREHQLTVKSLAIRKREEYIGTLNEVDKQFLPEIKSVLDKLPDHQIVSKTFDFGDLIKWAKGNHTDRLVKEAEERGFKRGLQQKKIIGEVGHATPAAKVKPKAATTAGSNMTAYQKKVAREMFPQATMSDEEAYAAYTEVTQGRKK